MRRRQARGSKPLQAVKPLPAKAHAPREVIGLNGRQGITITAPSRGVSPTLRASAARRAILGKVIKFDAIQHEFGTWKAGENFLINLERHHRIGNAGADPV